MVVGDDVLTKTVGYLVSSSVGFNVFTDSTDSTTLSSVGSSVWCVGWYVRDREGVGFNVKISSVG